MSDSVQKQPLTKEQKNSIKTFLSPLRKHPITLYHQTYSAINGIESERYIPADILFCDILPVLNDSRYDFYGDKNLADTLFPMIHKPMTYFRRINGFYYDSNMYDISEKEALQILREQYEVIIKTSVDSAQGDGVVLISSQGKTDNELIHKITEIRGDYIVQEKIDQHSFFKQFNPSSVNTLRILTYRNNTGVHILGVTMKIGKSGKFVDNGHAGGFFVGVTYNGILRSFVYSMSPLKRKECTENGIKVKGLQIPEFEKIINRTKVAALNLPYARYCGWDIALNKNGDPILIEVNVRCPGEDIIQIANGPLLGDYANEIMLLAITSKNNNT